MSLTDLLFGSANTDLFVHLFARYGVNIVAATILIRYIYYPRHRNKDFFFTFFLFNSVNFLICFLLSGSKLEMGFTFGLFAIFSILRYRTITVPIREMGYFFACIALALINSLVSLDNGLLLIVLGNVVIVSLIYSLERFSHLSHSNYKQINYERIDLIHPTRRAEMIADLVERTGLPITHVEIIKIDFLRDVARVNAFYLADSNEMTSVLDTGGDDD